MRVGHRREPVLRQRAGQHRERGLGLARLHQAARLALERAAASLDVLLALGQTREGLRRLGRPQRVEVRRGRVSGGGRGNR